MSDYAGITSSSRLDERSAATTWRGGTRGPAIGWSGRPRAHPRGPVARMAWAC